jgi:ubiquinone/menaquinone biosynthesis C-methylase UbiE
VNERIREVSDYWNSQAETYDEQFDHAIGSDEERAAWTRVFDTVTGNRDSLDVLDVGTGTGFLALELAAGGHRVVGIDLSPEMLSIARNKAAGRGLEVTFELGDAEQPSFPNSSFDLIISRHLFWALTDQSATLERWFHILRPDGHLAILDGDWCISSPADPAAPRSPSVDEVHATVEAHRFVDVRRDELTDLSEALNKRASLEGCPPDHFQRYLIWGRRPE